LFLPIWSSALDSGIFSLIPPVVLVSFVLPVDLEALAFCWFCWEWVLGLPLLPLLFVSVGALAVTSALLSVLEVDSIFSVVETLLVVTLEGFLSSVGDEDKSFSEWAWDSLLAIALLSFVFLWWLEEEEVSWEVVFLGEAWATFWEEDEWLASDSLDFWTFLDDAWLGFFWAETLLLEACLELEEEVAEGLDFESDRELLDNFSLLSDNFEPFFFIKKKNK